MRLTLTPGRPTSVAPGPNVNPSRSSEEPLRLRPGSNRCQCAGCGEYFASPTAFDRHQRVGNGDVRCLSEDEMRSRGMVRSDVGWWHASAAKWAPTDGGDA